MFNSTINTASINEPAGSFMLVQEWAAGIVYTSTDPFSVNGAGAIMVPGTTIFTLDSPSGSLIVTTSDAFGMGLGRATETPDGGSIFETSVGQASLLEATTDSYAVDGAKTTLVN